MPPLSILVIGPHPDDQELGMGGTIAKLAHQGHRVTILDLTDGCPTPVGSRERRLQEAAAAAACLAPRSGCGSVRRVMLDLPNRTLEHTIEARHKVAGVIRAVRADVLFMPHPEDAHPDHVAATRVCEDARFDAKLTGVTMPVPAGLEGDGAAPIHPRRVFYYYCSHLRSVPAPSFIVETSGFEARKREAILAYQSQFVEHAPNREVPERIAAADRYFGSRIHAEAGEPFWVKEPLGLSSLESVVI
jgi:bacillithiol biosynthesis deacetylase BshB1